MYAAIVVAKMYEVHFSDAYTSAVMAGSLFPVFDGHRQGEAQGLDPEVYYVLATCKHCRFSRFPALERLKVLLIFMTKEWIKKVKGKSLKLE